MKRALFASFVVALWALTVSGPASALDDGVQRERALESKSDLSVFDKAGPLSEGDSARIAELIDEDLGVELRAADSKGKTYVRGEAPELVERLIDRIEFDEGLDLPADLEFTMGSLGELEQEHVRASHLNAVTCWWSGFFWISVGQVHYHAQSYCMIPVSWVYIHTLYNNWPIKHKIGTKSNSINVSNTLSYTDYSYMTGLRTGSWCIGVTPPAGWVYLGGSCLYNGPF